ncbi:EthD domain-containing protein [Kineococcus aurantiacus]|uniref:EthD domain-containing protein n=1 Tax=Kineococcus aurantiacus TaxID=37633 RepID=A0A7Y9J3D4_9ACTN|nr:hypothetical protein [Kineococcus aurantiacus]
MNTYTTVVRRHHLAHEDFTAYWRDAHGPLCSRLPGLGLYVQHHFSRTHDAHLWPGHDDLPPLPHHVLDGAVEIGFASPDDQAVFQDASPLLFSDEQNVFAQTLAYDLPHGSQTLRDTDPDPTPNRAEPGDRLHVHLHARPGALADLAAGVQQDLAPALLADPGLVKLRLHLPTARDGDAEQPPAPDVDHHAAPQRRELVVAEIAFPDALTRRRALEGPAVRRALRVLAGSATHATAFAVSGVYTFVRDGRLTTAGLRGSRTAELITALAAVNQLDGRVERLFHP